MDLHTSKETAALHEEALMEKKKIRTDCKTNELQIKEEESGGGIMERKKFCTDCRTTKTPLWRLGPSGPKSLCNACGIRYRKKTPQSSHEEPETKSTVKMNLVILGKNWFLETASQGKQKKKKKLREEEEEIAAACLVAMSSGAASVFA